MSDEEREPGPWMGPQEQLHHSDGSFMNTAEVRHFQETGEERKLPPDPVSDEEEIEEEIEETEEPETPEVVGTKPGRLMELEQEIDAILTDAAGYFDGVRERVANLLGEIKKEAAAVMDARETVLAVAEGLRGIGLVKPTVPLAPTGSRRGRPKGSKNRGLSPRMASRLGSDLANEVATRKAQ